MKSSALDPKTATKLYNIIIQNSNLGLLLEDLELLPKTKPVDAMEVFRLEYPEEFEALYLDVIKD
jgi:hypothetical protein